MSDADAGRNPEVAYEPSDMSVAVVGWAALGVLLWLVLIPLILAWGYPASTGDTPKAPTVLPPEPRLQSDPRADLLSYEAEKERRLESYGWVDRDKGIVHIPIEVAMKRLASRGIPDWPGAGQAMVPEGQHR